MFFLTVSDVGTEKSICRKSILPIPALMYNFKHLLLLQRATKCDIRKVTNTTWAWPFVKTSVSVTNFKWSTGRAHKNKKFDDLLWHITGVFFYDDGNHEMAQSVSWVTSDYILLAISGNSCLTGNIESLVFIFSGHFHLISLATPEYCFSDYTHTQLFFRLYRRTTCVFFPASC